MIPKRILLRQYIKTYTGFYSGYTPPLDQIVHLYDLGKQWRYRPVGDFASSKTLILASERGKWMLKQYRKGTYLPAVQYIHSLLHKLAELKFPAPRLSLTKDDNDYVIVDEKCYALFDFVKGYRYDWFRMQRSLRNRHLKQVGTALAQYHLIAKKLVLPGYKNQGYKAASSKERWDDFSEYHDKWSELINQGSPIRNGKSLLSQATSEHISKRLIRLADVEKEQPLLPVTIIHGDYGPWNLLFGPFATLKTVLDFDDIRLEQRIDEIAASLIYFAGKTGVRLDLNDAQALLDAYQTVNPLTADELEALPRIFERHLLTKVVKILKRYHNTKSSLDCHKLQNEIAWLEWLETDGRTSLRTIASTASRSTLHSTQS